MSTTSTTTPGSTGQPTVVTKATRRKALLGILAGGLGAGAAGALALPGGPQGPEAGTALSGLGTAMAGHAGDDAELLAMAPAFEALYQRWIDHTIAERMRRQEFYAEVERRTGIARKNEPTPHDRDNPYWQVWHQVHDEMHADDPEEDEDGNPPRTFMDDLHDMAHEILWNHRPTTRAGVRLQVLAVTSSWCESWEGCERNTGPAKFFASMASFCGVPFPPYEPRIVDGYGDEDEEAGDAVDPIFAGIELHRKAEKEFDDRSMELSDTVWYEQEVEAGRTPNLRFLPCSPEANAEYDRLIDLAGDLAVRLIDTEITTAAGAKALLAYASELDARGHSMPDVIIEDGTERTWSWCLSQTITEAYERIAAA